jgi:hypothetical protein
MIFTRDPYSFALAVILYTLESHFVTPHPGEVADRQG